MYHTHFGLQKRLFDEGVAADAAVFRNRQHTELVEQFKLAFASATSVIVLRGPAGVGKSTLTSAALRATSTRLALAWLNGTPMNAAELLELMLVELGVNTARTSRIERLQLWRQFQAEMAATESRLFIVVERTEDLPVEVLHALDSSTAADAAGHPGANVVLLGHARIEDHLADPVLDSFRQRIRLRCELKPFTEAEVQEYLRHRVAAAGGQYDGVFALGAVAALHRYSRGVARLTNNLCETALTLAASRGQKLLTVDLVNEAAVTWLGLSEPQPIGVPSAANTTSVAAKPSAPAAPTAFTLSPAPMTVAASIALPASAPSVVASPAPSVAPIAPATPVARPAPTVAAPVVPPAPPPPAPAKTPFAMTRAAVAAASAAAPPPPPPPVAPTVAAPLPPPPPPRTPPTASAPPRPAPRVSAPPIVEEFDGGATDIPDVSIVDFPVLTDAVGDEPSAPSPAPIAAVAPPKPAPKAPPAPPRVAPPPRIETAYGASRPVTPAKPTAPLTPPSKTAAPAVPAKPAVAAPAASAPAPSPKPFAPVSAAAPSAPPKAPASRSPEPEEEDDLLRQTQTMRAIGEAKSIVDISDTMAETLFGDAELDFLATSLAATTGATETPPAPSAAKPSAPPATPAPTPAKAASSDDDDLLDLLGLSDAPLELIDDSAQPPADKPRKSSSQR